MLRKNNKRFDLSWRNRSVRIFFYTVLPLNILSIILKWFYGELPNIANIILGIMILQCAIMLGIWWYEHLKYVKSKETSR